MSPEKTKVLCEKYPKLFVYGPGVIQCDDGWFDLIEQLSGKLVALIPKDEKDFKVYQIKEKFGGLRFYMSKNTAEMKPLIHEAQEASFAICEVCGEPGTLGGSPWVRTLCVKDREEHEKRLRR